MYKLKNLVLNFDSVPDPTSLVVNTLCDLTEVPRVKGRIQESQTHPANFYIELKTPVEAGILKFRDNFIKIFGANTSVEICEYTQEFNEYGFFSLRFNIQHFLEKVIPQLRSFLETKSSPPEISDPIEPQEQKLIILTEPPSLRDIAILSVYKCLYTYPCKEILCDYIQQKPYGSSITIEILEPIIASCLFRLTGFSKEIENAKISQVDFFEISFDLDSSEDWAQLQKNLQQYFVNEDLQITTTKKNTYNIKFYFDAIHRILPMLQQEIDKAFLDIFSWVRPSVGHQIFLDTLTENCPIYSIRIDLFEHCILSLGESSEIPTRCIIDSSSTSGKILILLGISQAGAKQLTTHLCKIFNDSCRYLGESEHGLQSIEFSINTLLGPMFPSILERLNLLLTIYPDIYREQAKGTDIYRLLLDLQKQREGVPPFKLTNTQSFSGFFEALSNFSFLKTSSNQPISQEVNSSAHQQCRLQ